MFKTNAIFPTPVVSSNINRKLTKEELDVCDMHRKNVSRNYGNYYSKDNFVLNNSLSEIKKFIESGLDYYAENILCKNDWVDLYITQSWFNYTDTGGSHHLHTHTNSIISGVFYFNADINLDSIVFRTNNYNQISITPTQYNIFNTQSYTFPVETGTLLLFPSSLYHAVNDTTSDATRISLAFNVFAKGILGTPEELNLLSVSNY